MTSPGTEHAGAAALVVKEITKDFVGLRALDSVSLRLDREEILGLIGPNGSGKTTLVNVMTGFLKPTMGQVRVDDVDITRWPPHKIARFGLARTFQTIKLFKELTVLENVEVSACKHGVTTWASQGASLPRAGQPWSGTIGWHPGRGAALR